MSVHLAPDELADVDAGLLDPSRADEVRAHLAGCADCRETAAGLRRVSERLAAAPTPAMPAAVAARLSGVVRVEQARRERVRVAESASSAPQGWRRPTLGRLIYPGTGGRRRAAVTGLLAAGVAGAVGFTGYVVSATAGLNEPPVAQVAVDSARLDAQAERIRSNADLEPHRFSRAWRCAREVTEGRITGLTTAIVDGQPALLVYTQAGETTRATVVTGCAAGQPRAGATTVVSR